MCGVIGIVSNNPVNQMLYDGLLVLQHRGQDAAGIVTTDGNRFYMHKNNGLVKEVFQTRHMRNLIGNAGIAHVIQPGGSIKDQLSIDYCNENKISMVLTGTRHFKH